MILGDLQPPDDLETLLAPTLAITQVWWIPGNHDTDCEEYYDRLWHGPIAEHNLHGRVAEVAGLRIAGLGGVFRGQIWMPEGRPNYQSATGFVRRSPKTNLWRGGLPRRHRSSIFPATYEALQQCKADILVTHEAAGCHKKGFDAIDRLAKSLGVKWLFTVTNTKTASTASIKACRCALWDFEELWISTDVWCGRLKSIRVTSL